VLLHPGRDREHVRVEDEVLRREADVASEQVVGATADRDAAVDVRGLALLVERHHDDAGAVVADPPRLAQELLLALLEADRVDDPLALDALQAGLEHRPTRAVDHDRQTGDLRLRRDHVQEPAHRLLALEQVGVHVHVEHVRAAAHLLERDLDGAGEVVRLDEAPEACGAGDVRALADQHEPGVRPDLERLEAAPPRRRLSVRDPAGSDPGDRRRNRSRVLGRRAAAAAGDVEEARLGELAEQRARHVGRLVVAAECVREAGVRVRAREARRDARELGDVRAHLLRAERAVHADDQRVRVLDRRPERIDGLPAERAPGEVDDRRGDPQRQLGRGLARGGDRRLRVQRVEDRLEQQEVDPALVEGADLLRVRVAHLLERVRAEARIVDARAERERDVQRADRAGDELAAGLVGRGPRELGARDVHLVHRVLEPVVGLPDRRRRERVRRRDVRAGPEVAAVDRRDEIGVSEVEQVGVAAHVARVPGEGVAAPFLLAQPARLQQHAPRAVEHEDPLLREPPDLRCDVSRHRPPRCPKRSARRRRRGSLGVC
jgi:hypothetical protein